MTGVKTISAREQERPRVGPAVSGRPRFLLIALILSVVVHLVAALFVVLLPPVLSREAVPPAQGAVELLMVEQKGAKADQAGADQQDPAVASQPEKNVEAARPKAETAEPQGTSSAALLPPPVSETAEPVPPSGGPSSAMQREPAPEAPSDKAPAATQPPARPQEAPVFDLAGTESESNAVVLGSQVLPARPDDRFRNRPPVFPQEAEIRGLHGTVVVLIHVSEAGVATGADVLESSGVESLDQAALGAVRKWHFRPAMREGRTVPFDMPFRFIFEAAS
jgi:protein TonB